MTTFERKAVVLELAILAVTLIITSILGFAVFRQTTNHFAIQRTTYMIERFNQKELVDARDITDTWLRKKENAKALLDRAAYLDGQEVDSQKAATEKSALVTPREEARQTVQNIRVFCNFFQELGTAVKHDTLDEDVFGAVVKKYGEELRPFVEELRVRLQRPQLMQEFVSLVDKMKELDQKYGSK
jgi:hypothetical protein